MEASSAHFVLEKLEDATAPIWKVSRDHIAQDERALSFLTVTEDSLRFISTLTAKLDATSSVLHTLQCFGMRLHNSSLSALQSGMTGFYQVGTAQTRDLLEVMQLLALFQEHPSQLHAWHQADPKTRRKHFKPVLIRGLLNDTVRCKSADIEGVYQQLSEEAAHVSREGFWMLGPDDGPPMLGPFFDAPSLMALLGCQAYVLCLATSCLAAQPPVKQFKECTAARSEFARAEKAFRARCRAFNDPPA